MVENSEAGSVEAPSEELLELVREAVKSGRFSRLVLSGYRGRQAELKRVDVRLVELSRGLHLSFVSHYLTRDVTANLAVEAGLKQIAEMVDGSFKNVHLLAAGEEVEALFNRKGEARLRRLSSGGPTAATAGPVPHNRAKRRLLDQRAPFLRALGITNPEGRVVSAMADKWRQVNRFLEIFAGALEGASPPLTAPVRVVDFGAGKGYLTFAVHHYLTRVLGVEARVTGVELRPHLVELGNRVATELGYVGLTMEQGELAHFPLPETDILIALHACDTATDLALYSGVRAGARIILASPCCHHELRPQMRVPEVLEPLLRHGVHLGQEAEMVTDSIRALLLEEAGYKVQLMEFISLEHTDKNKLLLALRRSALPEAGPIRRKLLALMEFYGIGEQRLERLLRGEGSGPQSLRQPGE